MPGHVFVLLALLSRQGSGIRRVSKMVAMRDAATTIVWSGQASGNKSTMRPNGQNATSAQEWPEDVYSTRQEWFEDANYTRHELFEDINGTGSIGVTTMIRGVNKTQQFDAQTHTAVSGRASDEADYYADDDDWDEYDGGNVSKPIVVTTEVGGVDTKSEFAVNTNTSISSAGSSRNGNDYAFKDEYDDGNVSKPIVVTTEVRGVDTKSEFAVNTNTSISSAGSSRGSSAGSSREGYDDAFKDEYDDGNVSKPIVVTTEVRGVDTKSEFAVNTNTSISSAGSSWEYDDDDLDNYTAGLE